MGTFEWFQTDEVTNEVTSRTVNRQVKATFLTLLVEDDRQPADIPVLFSLGRRSSLSIETPKLRALPRHWTGAV